MALAMEMGEVESGRYVLEECICLQANCVLTQAEVQVGIALDFHVACIGTYDPEFCTGTIMQGVSFGLCYFAAYGDVVLVVAVEEVEGIDGGSGRKFEMFEFMRCKERYASLGPFIEAFAQLNPKGVLDIQSLGLVREV